MVSGTALDPEHIQVWASEGSWGTAESTEQGIRLNWMPSEARQAHMAVLGVRDLREAGAQPQWLPVRLRARPPVTVRTEPGTSLKISLGGRDYGPVNADDAGVATARVDVFPGEQTASALLSDALGNTQRTTITIGPPPDPVLGLFVEGYLAAGDVPPRLHMRALTGAGRPWGGPIPECRTAGGDGWRLCPSAKALDR